MVESREPITRKEARERAEACRDQAEACRQRVLDLVEEGQPSTRCAFWEECARRWDRCGVAFDLIAGAVPQGWMGDLGGAA